MSSHIAQRNYANDKNFVTKSLRFGYVPRGLTDQLYKVCSYKKQYLNAPPPFLEIEMVSEREICNPVAQKSIFTKDEVFDTDVN